MSSFSIFSLLSYHHPTQRDTIPSPRFYTAHCRTIYTVLAAKVQDSVLKGVTRNVLIREHPVFLREIVDMGGGGRKKEVTAQRAVTTSEEREENQGMFKPKFVFLPQTPFRSLASSSDHISRRRPFHRREPSAVQGVLPAQYRKRSSGSNSPSRSRAW